MTPLYDAVGRMIAKVDADIAARAEHGAPAEDQVVVIITDGLENHSREQTRSTIFEMIERRRQDGWVFVFLGANQDVYVEGGRMAVPVGNRAAWAATKPGSAELWKDVSHSTSEHRAKLRHQRVADADEFYKKREPSERRRRPRREG